MFCMMVYYYSCDVFSVMYQMVKNKKTICLATNTQIVKDYRFKIELNCNLCKFCWSSVEKILGYFN